MKKSQLETLPSRLHLGEGGCWYAPATGPVSYPAGGNEDYFAIEDDSYWFRHRNTCLLALIRRWPPAGTLFDVGGGNGAVAAAVQNAGLDVVLVEPGPDGARNARRRGVESVVCASLEDAGFSPASIPAIGLFDVLEHIEDDQAFLRLLATLLSPGGRLYMTVPAYRWLWSAEDRHAGHFRRYGLRGLRRQLERAGFRVEYAGHLFYPLLLPILLFRTLPSLVGLAPRPGREQARRDHASGSLGARLLRALLRPEARRLEAGGRIPMGSSCVMVATKTGGTSAGGRSS